MDAKSTPVGGRLLSWPNVCESKDHWVGPLSVPRQSYHWFFREEEVGFLGEVFFDFGPLRRTQEKQRQFLEKFGRPTEAQRLEARASSAWLPSPDLEMKKDSK